MFNKLKNLFSSAKPVSDVDKIVPVFDVSSTEKSPKERAEELGEPWVSVTAVDLDPDNIGNGSLTLDWNDKFITNLVRAGYQGKTDQALVDFWFQTICRNILAETYEQEQADPDNRHINKRDLGSGRSEIS
jgi:hypothetical protein